MHLLQKPRKFSCKLVSCCNHLPLDLLNLYSYMKIWRKGTTLDCDTEDRRFEPARLTLIYAGTENCREIPTLVEINRFWSKFTSSSSEFVGVTRSACRKSVPSPWYLSTASSCQPDAVFRQLFLQCKLLLKSPVLA